MPTDDQVRIREARQAAYDLGYYLLVDEALNIEPITHMAFAASVVRGQATVGRFLAYGQSASEAAERGLDTLRGIVERDEPWPTS